MFKVRHYHPTTFPPVDSRPDPAILELIPQIMADAIDRWIRVSNTDLEVRLEQIHESTRVYFARQGKLVYTHILCLVGCNAHTLFEDVRQLLRQFKHSEPVKPRDSNWIYSIPTSRIPPGQTESNLIHGIVLAIFALLLIERFKCATLN